MQQHFGTLVGEVYGTADRRPPLVFLHGLTYDRRQWGPVLAELSRLDPDRQVAVLDLPGHGESAARDSYRSGEVVEAIQQAIEATGFDVPALVGHSLGGVLATTYADRYPTRGVVNVDQPLLLGGFGPAVRRMEPALRGPDFLDVWRRMLAGMQIDQLPPAAQVLVQTATTPRQDLLLGYWAEIFDTPLEELDERQRRALAHLHRQELPFHYISGHEPQPEYRSWLETTSPGVGITVLPDSGHFPHLAHPSRVAEVLVKTFS